MPKLLLISLAIALGTCDQPGPTKGSGSAANRYQDLPRLASNAPVDQVFSTPLAGPEYAALVKQARTQLPSVRDRFLHGLPPDHHLFVTTILHTPSTNEQVFVAVRDWSDPALVDGLIATEPGTPGYRAGDEIKVRDRDIVDWTISRPDGSEEGNALGQWLESKH